MHIRTRYVRDHTYIRQQKDWGGWVHKMAFFADGKYCYNYADLVGGSDKFKRITVVI